MATTIRSEDLPGGLRRVSLQGRMDMVGVEQIDLRLTALTAALPLRVLLDLTRSPSWLRWEFAPSSRTPGH